VLDARGKIAWGRSDIGGDPIVAVLPEQVADTHLAGRRKDIAPYIFAGERDLDLGLALETLNREPGPAADRSLDMTTSRLNTCKMSLGLEELVGIGAP